jgi:lipoic acid synthetase
MGFQHVAAGPLVRSSYHADEHVAQHQPGLGPVRQRSGASGLG